MRDENNVVYKSDNDHNPRVLKAMQIERSVNNPRDFIDCLAGGKSLENVNNKDRIEWQVKNELPEKKFDNGDPEPLFVDRVEYENRNSNREYER